MARISLLFTLAFALALGSFFLSASGHASRRSSTPKTVAELQSLPFTEITRILNRKERFAPKTVEFKAMFTMCKGYVTYLESLYKLGHPIVDVLGISKEKYTLMTKAILVAGASVSGKVDKKAFLKLTKSYIGMTKGFLKIQKTIITISAKHNFNSNAKITFHESEKIADTVIIFKKSINAFMNIIHDVEEKNLKKIRRELTEGDVKFTADSHVGANIKGSETIFEKFSRFFGGYLGSSSNLHGRELTQAQSGGIIKASFGKVHFSAAGKMNFAGKDGFRQINRAHYKHLVSTHD